MKKIGLSIAASLGSFCLIFHSTCVLAQIDEPPVVSYKQDLTVNSAVVEADTEAVSQNQSLETTTLEGQVISVSQLKDVQPTDWAFQALQSLVERYGAGALVGYPDGTFRGNRAMTRYEFAAALNAALDRINELISTGKENLVSRENLATLQRLQQEFAVELATLRGRVDALETRTAELEANQFSTTTKLTGQAIFAVNAGGFDGERIIAPRGAVVSEDQPNPTVIYRASLDLNTSFSGNDLLKIRLVTGSDGITDNAAGFLEPNLGSTLDFSVPGRDGQFSLARLYYTFAPVKDLKVTIGPAIVAPDFVDKNRYASVSFLDFSTQALVSNFILLPRPGGAGAVVDWHPGGGALKLRGIYVAGDATNSFPENQRLFGGGGLQDIRLFPTGGGGLTGVYSATPTKVLWNWNTLPAKLLLFAFSTAAAGYLVAVFRGLGSTLTSHSITNWAYLVATAMPCTLTQHWVILAPTTGWQGLR